MSPSPERSSASEVTARVARRWSPAISTPTRGFRSARAEAGRSRSRLRAVDRHHQTLHPRAVHHLELGDGHRGQRVAGVGGACRRREHGARDRVRRAALEVRRDGERRGRRRGRFRNRDGSPRAFRRRVLRALRVRLGAHQRRRFHRPDALDRRARHLPRGDRARLVQRHRAALRERVQREPAAHEHAARAHAPTAATYTSGDMSSAHGAAAERNANARYIAPALPMNGMPNTTGPSTIVASVIPSMALLYRSPNVSSNRETAGRRFCAASVKRAMRAGVECSASRVVRTTSAPSLFTAPAGISSPTRFETGSASPVMCWMETSALPCVTMPSKGTCRFRETFSVFDKKVSRSLQRGNESSRAVFFRVEAPRRIQKRLLFARFAFAVVRRLRWVNG